MIVYGILRCKENLSLTNKEILNLKIVNTDNKAIGRVLKLESTTSIKDGFERVYSIELDKADMNVYYLNIKDINGEYVSTVSEDGDLTTVDLINSSMEHLGKFLPGLKDEGVTVISKDIDLWLLQCGFEMISYKSYVYFKENKLYHYAIYIQGSDKSDIIEITFEFINMMDNENRLYNCNLECNKNNVTKEEIYESIVKFKNSVIEKSK